jgi:hypothetical protein
MPLHFRSDRVWRDDDEKHVRAAFRARRCRHSGFGLQHERILLARYE